MTISDKHIHILEKAEALFAAKGYEGTTVRDIAQAAGINLAMINYYFGSKEKLMEILFKERMGSVKMRIEAVVNSKDISPFQKFDILIDQYITRVFSRQDFYKVMFTEQLLQKNTNVLNALKEYKREFISLIDEVIAQGCSQGIFTNGVDTMILLNSMTGTVMNMLINKEHYREYHNHTLNDEAFEEIIKTKLSEHLKKLFKATLAYDQKEI